MTPEEVVRQQANLERLLKQACLKSPRFTIVTSPTKVVYLVSYIQLALRHPRVPRQSAAIVRTMKDHMIGSLDSLAPGIGEILRLGDDPSIRVY